MKTCLISLVILISDFWGGMAQPGLPQSKEPPGIPVGEQAYLQWDRLPYQRIGIRAYMRSTYDRTGNNRSADASHFLYQESDTFNVTLDVKGNGMLYFIRTNHFHGSPWYYEIDGNTLTVKETATEDPIDARSRYPETEFIPHKIFPNPLTWTWTTTRGADLMWRPIPFHHSFRLAYGRTFYGTGYYIYHLFPEGMRHILHRSPTWREEAPDQRVLDLINRSGTDIAPKGEGVTKYTGELVLEPLQQNLFCSLTGPPCMIRALRFILPVKQAADFGNCRLKVTWDNRWAASIDAPVDLFFGSGELYNDNGRAYLVKGFPLSIRYTTDSVFLSCYWPMPFFTGARFEIEERNEKKLEGIRWEIRTVPYTDPINRVAYFHATYTDHETPEEGQDLTFLDTRQAEGGGEWSGHFVGMSWIFTRNGQLATLEGDPRFFFDDCRTPQAWGTGTEEWGGGGDYWGGENMTLPFAGHPIGKDSKNAESRMDLLNSAYRFLVADFFPFGKRAVINLEHGGLNTYDEHYSGVAYWYGMDAPTLVLTDELNVCNKADIESHRYVSPTATEPYPLVSRYEWGPDNDSPDFATPPHKRKGTHQSRMFFPAEEDSVRTMKGVSQFAVKICPGNLGILIRRKFDYLYPNQHARVSVRAAGSDDWDLAGEWYTAGSNTCIFSNPGGRSFTAAELGETQHEMVTSNRRWREEEFVIGRELTEGIDSLEIKIEHIPDSTQLFPGQDFPAVSVWSEARYRIYCYSMPWFHPAIRRGAFNPDRQPKEN